MKKKCQNCDFCIKQPKGWVCICEKSEKFLEEVDTGEKCEHYVPVDED